MLYSLTLIYKNTQRHCTRSRKDYAASALEWMARTAVRAEANLDTARGVEFVQEADWLAECLREGLSDGVYNAVNESPGFEICARVQSHSFT